MRIGLVMGSTRPWRNNEAVARWVLQIAGERDDAEFELIGIAQYDLPLLDEPVPPCLGQYAHAHTKAWAAKIASFDRYVFVTPEYHHGIPAALKNAIDYLFAEWNDKAAGFVSYGSVGGVRVAEQLRLVIGGSGSPMCGVRSSFRSSPTSRISRSSGPCHVASRSCT